MCQTNLLGLPSLGAFCCTAVKLFWSVPLGVVLSQAKLHMMLIYRACFVAFALNVSQRLCRAPNKPRCMYLAPLDRVDQQKKFAERLVFAGQCPDRTVQFSCFLSTADVITFAERKRFDCGAFMAGSLDCVGY